MKKDSIIMAHGGGGELMQQLIAEHILPRLGNDVLDSLDDAARLSPPDGPICMTTDAYVVQPLFFPGGDIGRLAVCGTVNDLAMAGATPVALSLAMVLQEGLPLATLDAVLDSIAVAAGEASVRIVTGDTKVIERSGSEPGMTITTAGIGRLHDKADLDTARIEPTDAILVSGPLGEHGLAVLSSREGLAFATDIRSDAAPLTAPVMALLDANVDVKFLRDPTRSGLAGVVCDLADATGLSIELREDDLPIPPPVRAAADMLGLDPLSIANEGKFVAVVPDEHVDRAVSILANQPLSTGATIVGTFTPDTPPLVELATAVGGRRVVSRPYGEDLPRIC